MSLKIFPEEKVRFCGMSITEPGLVYITRGAMINCTLAALQFKEDSWPLVIKGSFRSLTISAEAFLYITALNNISHRRFHLVFIFVILFIFRAKHFTELF